MRSEHRLVGWTKSHINFVFLVHGRLGMLRSNMFDVVARSDVISTVEIPDRIISADERRQLVPYSDMHVWRLERDGLFPKRIQLAKGKGRVGWSFREVQEWIEQKKAERDDG